ncbi:MAG: S8 family peptidase [Bacteriovoracaceae bacterium]
MKMLALLLSLSFTFGASAKDFDGYIVKFKSGGLEKFQSEKSSLVGNDLKPFAQSLGEFAVLKTKRKSALNMIARHPAVEYIEPNWIVTIDSMKGETIEAEQGQSFQASNKNLPWDTQFSKQWALLNTGRNSATGGLFGSSPGKKGMDVKALDAWNMTRGDSSVVVAVIDTGVDYKHQDLHRNIWVNELEKNGSLGVDDDGNGYVDDVYGYDFANNDSDPMDGHGHGTHCAGVIGATHNSIGIAGIMNEVTLLSVKFLSDKGSGTMVGAIRSVEYAVKNGAHILSNSWGGGPRSEALYDAIKAAGDQGVLFVAAAGNSKSNNDKKPTYPATYQLDNVVSVGAMNGKGKRASFSSYGARTVHVFAPGENIVSTIPGHKYQSMSGTSMATPLVSGIAGLLLSKNPGLTYEEIRDILIKSSNKSLDLNSISQSDGRVNAYRALLQTP